MKQKLNIFNFINIDKCLQWIEILSKNNIGLLIILPKTILLD